MACCSGCNSPPAARSSIGDELRPVELAQKQDAGVERLVADGLAVAAREDDRAGSAVPLGAAFLRARRAGFLAQPVEDGGARRKPVERDLGAAEAKAHGVARGG